MVGFLRVHAEEEVNSHANSDCYLTRQIHARLLPKTAKPK